MPINKFENKTEFSQADIDGLILVLTNGDRAALDQAISRWNFKNAESFLKFVVAVMLKAEGNKIFIQVEGNQAGITPNETLLNTK